MEDLISTVLVLGGSFVVGVVIGLVLGHLYVAYEMWKALP